MKRHMDVNEMVKIWRHLGRNDAPGGVDLDMVRVGADLGVMVRVGVDDGGTAERVLSVMAFHEKAGRSQYNSSLASLNKFFSPAKWTTVAMLPSALSRSDSFRSVHVGRSRFSRCCHLLGALWFCSCRVEPRPGD